MKIGIPGLLFVAFLVLKITGVVDWGWLWLTSPLWIALTINTLALAFAGIVFMKLHAAKRL